VPASSLSNAKTRSLDASQLRASPASLSIARRKSIHFHALSSAAGVEAVEQAQRAGADLIAETCPQYLILEQSMEEQIGCWGKVNPPPSD
jgi:dihydroorotase-like cyclic amidohydrolase